MSDTAAPDRVTETGEGATALNAFVLTAFSFAAVIMAYVVAVYFVFSELRIGMVAGAAIAVCTAGLGVWSKRSKTIVWPARIFLVATLLCITFVAFINGGADGYIAPFMIVGPLIAGYFLGARSSIFFGAVTILCTLGLHVADLNGLVIESPFDPKSVETAAVIVVVTGTFLALITSSFFASRVSLHASQIEQSRALLASMAEVAEVGGWELDIKTMSIVWTDQTRRIHEVADDYMPKLDTAIDFYAPEAREPISNAVQKCIDHDEPFDLELPLITAKGRRIWVRAVGKKVYEGGASARLIGAFQDITNRIDHARELDARRIDAEAASLAKSQFLATMSHEIRTPMNGVMGMLQLILQDDLSDDQRRRAQIGQESAQALMRVIDDVLDFSKIEAGQIALESIPFSPADLVDRTVALMELRAEEKGLALSFEIDGGVPPWLAGDPVRIKQILLNLVGNAVKFTQSGSVTVRADYRAEPGSGTLTIVVEDTGIGIPAEHHDKLFDRFVQADSTTTRKFGGSGLGLAISKQLVELMGGEINVDSAPGKGSAFSFSIPAEKATPNVGFASDAAEVETSAALQAPLNVLVAEDNSVNQLLMKSFLQSEKHNVSIVNNGAEALAAVQSEPFDIVLMDVQMPVMDGVAATRAIRGLSGRKRETPIIAVTADAMESDKHKFLACGMDDYLSKPVQSKALFDAIARVISRKARGAAAENHDDKRAAG